MRPRQLDHYQGVFPQRAKPSPQLDLSRQWHFSRQISCIFLCKSIFGFLCREFGRYATSRARHARPCERARVSFPPSRNHPCRRSFARRRKMRDRGSPRSSCFARAALCMGVVRLTRPTSRKPRKVPPMTRRETRNNPHYRGKSYNGASSKFPLAGVADQPKRLAPRLTMVSFRSRQEHHTLHQFDLLCRRSRRAFWSLSHRGTATRSADPSRQPGR